MPLFVHDILALCGRIILALIGTTLIFFAFFLYENEEGRLQNKLERLWRRIRILQRIAISREAAFMRVVIQATLTLFDAVFGKRLIGPKAVAASLSYSAAAILFAGLWWMGGPFKTDDLSWPLPLHMFVAAAVFVGIGSLGPVITSKRAQLVWTMAAGLLAIGFLFSAVTVMLELGDFYSPDFGETIQNTWYAIAPETLCVVVVAMLSDFAFVTVVRVIFRFATRYRTFWRVFVTAAGTSVVGCGLVWLPLKAVPLVGNQSNSTVMKDTFLLIGASNVLDALVSVVWLGVSVILLCHRIVWPVMARPVYALHRHHVITKQRKLVFFVGVAFLSLAFPKVGDLLEAAVKAIHA